MSEDVSDVLRAFVRQRAGHRCEYCLLHEDDAVLCHEPDHVIARKHRGETTITNLAWACFICNRHKGSDIASIDMETGKLVRLFNPRTDDWNAHFRLDQGRIIPVTPEARFTEHLLQLNRPERIRVRLELSAAGRYPR